MQRRASTVLNLVLAVVFLAACESPPYVYKENEFNRRSATFAQDIKDRTELTICYNKGDSRPLDVLEMAKEECSQFGKSARFLNQDRATCPLMTPIAANFSCVK
jgi:hypothetical protein